MHDENKDTNDSVHIGASAIALIQDTAVAAKGVQRVDVDDCEPDYVKRFFSQDKGLQTIVLEPQQRHHGAQTLEALCELATDASKREPKGEAIVWVDRNTIRLVFDDQTRRHCATLTLEHTPQFRTVIALKRLQAMQQADFRRLLRVELDGALPAESELVKKVSNVKWEAGRMTSGDLDHTKSAMSAELTAELMGQSGFPEWITLTLRLFDVPDLKTKRQIRCAITVNPEDTSFKLEPLPMACEEALDQEIEEIVKTIKAAVTCPVYRGSL